MKLYITAGSPYARIARIVILEKWLEGRVEIVPAQTRLAESPYYRVNPSGRVPYLVRDDGVGMEEAAIICRYLDHLDGRPVFDLPAGDPEWEASRLGALASSLLDGLSVWGREIVRPENEQSPTIIRHETDRARRMADLWETEIEHPLPDHFAQSPEAAVRETGGAMAAVGLGRRRILPPHIERGATEAPVLQRGVERILINDCRPRDIDQKRARLHQGEAPAVDQPLRLRRQRASDEDRVAQAAACDRVSARG